MLACPKEIKRKERERRSVGQALAEQKKRKESEEMKRHSENIRREKATQKAEMEAIRLIITSFKFQILL